MDDSATTCDEIIDSYDDETKISQQILEKKATCKTQNFYILLVFLLMTVTFLISVSIYCYVIKCQVKQKHLLPFQFTNNKLKEIMY